MVGYFPEGVYYGPQSQDPSINCKTIVLQFGGASGSGYLSQAEVKAGMDELKADGEFKDGIFRRRADVEGKRNIDGYQAIWEHVNDRPMVYPKPRYPQPIFMDPATYDWVPVEGSPGVCGEAARRVHRAAQRSRHGSDRRRRYLSRRAARASLSSCAAAARLGGEPMRALTTVYLDAR